VIDIQHIDEHGAVLGTYPDPDVTTFLFESAAPAPVCVKFIASYGDTYFNQLQLPVLIAEVAALAQAERNAARRGRIQHFRSWLVSLEGQIHTYVRFVGD